MIMLHIKQKEHKEIVFEEHIRKKVIAPCTWLNADFQGIKQIES